VAVRIFRPANPMSSAKSFAKRKKKKDDAAVEKFGPNPRQQPERTVQNPLVILVRKRDWPELQLDEAKSEVLALKFGPNSTLINFLWAVSRYFHFQTWKEDESAVISEANLIAFADFLFRLTGEPKPITQTQLEPLVAVISLVRFIISTKHRYPLDFKHPLPGYR
jgi:hypothetical protein